MDQGYTQGYVTGEDCYFPGTGYSRGFRECSLPTLVTPNEGGLSGSSVGTGIAYQLNLVGSRIIME